MRKKVDAIIESLYNMPKDRFGEYEGKVESVETDFTLKKVCKKCRYWTGKKEHKSYKCYTKNCPAHKRGQLILEIKSRKK